MMKELPKNYPQKARHKIHPNSRTYRPKETDAIYMASGSWKCEPSPTGAHHWEVSGKGMTCKHCKVFRKFSEEQIDHNYI